MLIGNDPLLIQNLNVTNYHCNIQVQTIKMNQDVIDSCGENIMNNCIKIQNLTSMYSTIGNGSIDLPNQVNDTGLCLYCLTNVSKDFMIIYFTALVVPIGHI